MKGRASELLGVVLAGGESSRFGSPKGLAPLGGRPMATWALEALAPHFSKRGVIANDPAVSQALEFPGRSDTVPGMGPLGGLVTALAWAQEEGLAGAFLLGCDLPLVNAELLGRILRHPLDRGSALVPASAGPLGMEPLCAAYSLECLTPAEELLSAGRRSMKALLDAVGYTLVPMEALGSGEELSRAFLNVNTTEEAEYVEEIMKRGKNSPGAPKLPPTPPILCIVGKKNSGKTTLTVALAAELNRRGRKVMTVKSGHGFQLDQPGRDSWRHRHEGGAVRTVLAGPRDFGVVGEWPGEEMPLAELVRRFLWDAEIVLAEGFKFSAEPRIEVYRREAQPERLYDSSAQTPGRTLGRTLALVTDEEGLDLPIPVFPLGSPDHEGPSGSVAALADFVETNFLKNSEVG